MEALEELMLLQIISILMMKVLTGTSLQTLKTTK